MGSVAADLGSMPNVNIFFNIFLMISRDRTYARGLSA